MTVLLAFEASYGIGNVDFNTDIAVICLNDFGALGDVKEKRYELVGSG